MTTLMGRWDVAGGRGGHLVRGQAAAEMALLVAATVTALVIMGKYLERSMAGSAFQSATTHGQQFDPSGAWNDTKTVTADQTLTYNYRYNLPRIIECCGDKTVGVGGATGSQLPTAMFGGGVLIADVKANANWNVKGDATYQTSTK